MASRDPDDPDFRRLWYVRYADDFLLGFSGPREEAEQIKQRLQAFLHETPQAGTLAGEDADHACPNGGGTFPRLRDRHPGRRLQARPSRSALHQRRTGTEGARGCHPQEMLSDTCVEANRSTWLLGDKKRTSASSLSTRRNTGASCNTTCWPSTSIACGDSTGS